MHKLLDTPWAVDVGHFVPEASESRVLAEILRNLPLQSLSDLLTQTYAFAQGFTEFQAFAVARTPRPAQRVLITALNDRDAQMDFIEEIAPVCGIDLNIEPVGICRRYTDYLIASAHNQPFQVLLAITCAVETCCLESWKASKESGPYSEYIRRSSNGDFEGYVQLLKELCQQHPHAGQKAAFEQVVRYERELWQEGRRRGSS